MSGENNGQVMGADLAQDYRAIWNLMTLYVHISSHNQLTRYYKVLQESYLCQYLGMKSYSKASRVSSAASAAKISLVELSVLEIVIVDLLPKLFSL